MTPRACGHYHCVAGDVDQEIRTYSETRNHIEVEVNPCQVCLNVDEGDREAPEDVNGVPEHLDFRGTERIEICKRVVADVEVEVRITSQEANRILADETGQARMVVPRPVVVEAGALVRLVTFNAS